MTVFQYESACENACLCASGCLFALRGVVQLWLMERPVVKWNRLSDVLQGIDTLPELGGREQSMKKKDGKLEIQDSRWRNVFQGLNVHHKTLAISSSRVSRSDGGDRETNRRCDRDTNLCHHTRQQGIESNVVWNTESDVASALMQEAGKFASSETESQHQDTHLPGVQSYFQNYQVSCHFRAAWSLRPSDHDHVTSSSKLPNGHASMSPHILP